MLCQTLSTHRDLWSLYRESQEMLEKTMAALEAQNSVVLWPKDLQPGDTELPSRTFFDQVDNAEAVGAISSRVPFILRAKLNKILTSGRNGHGCSDRLSAPVIKNNETDDERAAKCLGLPVLLHTQKFIAHLPVTVSLLSAIPGSLLFWESFTG